MKEFSPTHNSDSTVNRMASEIKTILNSVARVLLNDGRLTDSVALTTSFQDVPHKLGRKPAGWFVVSPDADVRVWEDAAGNNPDQTKFIRVKGSAAANLKFWVF